MQKVANCPVCKKKPFPYHYEDHTEYVHCGVKCEDEGTWNRYAAAMELAKAAIRQDECEQKLSGLTTDLFFETHKESEQADRDCWKAFEKVKEVFK